MGFVVLGFFYLQFSPEYYKEYPQALGGLVNDGLPFWAGFGTNWLDMRPAWTCLIGIILAITLNKVTSYYTHTQYEPVKSLAKACQTGHATNIIQGFAVGYESAVVGTLVIAVAILLSVLIYAGAGPIFVAYGVAMCGIGMLTLTGNTISMDVFGPVADNANGIGEMGYDREEMGEENYKRARQILADLDAVGNTTKAETKGIAIGSAVIAAVSLFASFIAVMAVGSEDKIGQMTVEQYTVEAGKLSIAYPEVFVGALIGGVVPFLFSSMLIRAVGRAAFLIVKECRVQFRDKEIWAGTKKPDYGRVVNICTATAQSELIGPALLAILMPILVGIFLGTTSPGRLSRRHDHRRPAAGRVHGQRRRRLGQRQEDDRGRHLRRQGLRGPQGGRHRRHRRRSLEGHRRPGLEPADQGHEHGRPPVDRADPRLVGPRADLALPGRHPLHRRCRLGRLAEQDRKQGAPRDGRGTGRLRRSRQEPRDRGQCALNRGPIETGRHDVESGIHSCTPHET